MSAAPRLLAGKRRALAALLAALALGEAVLAVLFAAALDRMLSADVPSLLALLSAAGIAVMAAAALLLARWVGEDFAQSFVADCRAALFTAVTRQPEGSNDARWLTVLLNDMAALRNYALRGTVSLWMSALAASAAALWAGLAMPHLAAGLIPLAAAAGLIGLLFVPLTRAVAAQRRKRGEMNRFLVRRVRAELAGTPPTRGHGFRKLDTLSGELAQASVTRALHAGAMDAAASLAGLAAALLLVWYSRAGSGTEGLAGGLMLLGFIAARLLECARALHARIGGRLAIGRLEALLAEAPARRRRTRPRPAARQGWRQSWKRWLPLRLSLNPALPAPPQDGDA